MIDELYDDDYETTRAELEQRVQRERQNSKQARIERMRRVSPKGVYFPAKLLKARKRVAATEV